MATPRPTPNPRATHGDAVIHVPVLPGAACLQEALERDDQHGIWGGLTPNERKALT